MLTICLKRLQKVIYIHTHKTCSFLCIVRMYYMYPCKTHAVIWNIVFKMFSKLLILRYYLAYDYIYCSILYYFGISLFLHLNDYVLCLRKS